MFKRRMRVDRWYRPYSRGSAAPAAVALHLRPERAGARCPPVARSFKQRTGVPCARQVRVVVVTSGAGAV